jgi:hypothetical protein
MATIEIQRRITRQNSGSNIQLSNLMFKDYVLNKNKTIQKKHDACSKPHIEATLKAGNNLVLEFSTAAHELAKQTLSAILDKSMQYYGRPVAKYTKPKINNPEDKAYIIKLENENNKLKSTIEMQNNLGSYQHQSSVPPFTTTCTQDSSLINTQNAITSIESKINDQRFRMLEFQMMQNMTMNNMISNQQMQIMMQQQQMTQQSYAHPNYGQPMYPTIPIRRFIRPPPGFLQNPMPPNYPYNGTFTPAFGPHQHVNSNSHLIRTHPGANQHVNYQNPHLTDMHSRATYKNTNQQPMYGSTQNQHYEHISRGARVNIPPHNVHVSHPDNNRHVEAEPRKHTGDQIVSPRFIKHRSTVSSQNKKEIPVNKSTQQQFPLSTNRQQDDNEQMINTNRSVAPLLTSPRDINSGSNTTSQNECATQETTCTPTLSYNIPSHREIIHDKQEASPTELVTMTQSTNLDQSFLGIGQIKLPPDISIGQKGKNPQNQTN